MSRWLTRLLTPAARSSAKTARPPKALNFCPAAEELEPRLTPSTNTLALTNNSGQPMQVLGLTTDGSQALTSTAGFAAVTVGSSQTSFALAPGGSFTITVNSLNARIYFQQTTTPFTEPSTFGGFDPNTTNTIYDFIELNNQPGTLFIDTTQVDQFGIPITLTDTNSNPPSLGVAPNVTRSAILSGYTNFVNAQSNLSAADKTAFLNLESTNRIEAPSKLPAANYPLANYWDSPLTTVYNGTNPLRITVSGVAGGPFTYVGTPVQWQYGGGTTVNLKQLNGANPTTATLPTLTEAGAAYNYQASDQSQFWPVLEFAPPTGMTYPGEAEGPFFVFAPFWQANGYATNPLTSAASPTTAPSWIVSSNNGTTSAGQQVFGAQGIFADQGAGAGTGSTAGQVSNTPGNQTLYQNILANLENQMNAALQRGVANLNYTTTTPPGGGSYPDDTTMWSAGNHTPYYPVGQVFNVYAAALHNMQVTNTQGQSVFPFINQQAYAISYDDQGNNASIFPALPPGDTVTVTLDPFSGSNGLDAGFDELGAYRPSNGSWVLDSNDQFGFQFGGIPGPSPGSDRVLLNFTPSGANLATVQPVSGDWAGLGTTEIGDEVAGTWYLDLNNNGQVDPGETFSFGTAQDLPVPGHYLPGAGIELAVFRIVPGAIGEFIISDPNWLQEAQAGQSIGISTSFDYGSAGDQVVVGDWNGQGLTEVGVYRPATAFGAPNAYVFSLDVANHHAFDSSNKVFVFGSVGDGVVIGDWNNSGTSKVGVYRPATAFGAPNTAVFSLDETGQFMFNSNSLVFLFGTATDRYVTGDWAFTTSTAPAKRPAGGLLLDPTAVDAYFSRP